MAGKGNKQMPLLGPGRLLGGGLGIPGAADLLNDQFLTDRAAGAVNGTLAEPGPGVRAVTDTNSKLSISGGAANFATGGAGNSDPSIYYDSFDRVAGRILVANGSVSGGTMTAGWDETAAVPLTDCVRFQSSGLVLAIRADTVNLAVGVFESATAYRVAVIMRSEGSTYFIQGGAFGNWILLYISHVEVLPMRPALGVEGTAAVAAFTYVAVPAARWLPAPLISDGFSVWGTSDGLGHAEGVAGGIGSGGSGLAWTTVVGTWGAAGGVAAASALTGGRAIATADSGKADLIATVNCTRSAGSMALIVRWVDENNFIRVSINATNCVLVKVVAGVATTVSDVAYTYVAGAPLRVICQGSAFRRFYNNVAIGAEFTIADAALQAPTVVGLRTDNTGNTFDNFVCFARGTAGEYNAVLDAI